MNINQEREYLDYVNTQRENLVDLSKVDIETDVSVAQSQNQNQNQNADPITNDSITNDSNRLLAEIIFSKKPMDVKFEQYQTIFDEDSQSADVFCAMLEFILYGINILSESQLNIFMLDSTTNDSIYLIQNYLKPMNLTMCIEEISGDDPSKINLFRDRKDFYCEITEKPPSFLCFPGWYILDYRFILNNKFDFDVNTKLDVFKAVFVTKEKKVFMINFKFCANESNK